MSVCDFDRDNGLESSDFGHRHCRSSCATEAAGDRFGVGFQKPFIKRRARLQIDAHWIEQADTQGPIGGDRRNDAGIGLRFDEGTGDLSLAHEIGKPGNRGGWRTLPLPGRR